MESYARDHHADDPQARQELRDQWSRPVLANLREWLDENEPQVRPKSPIGKAIRYMSGQWSRLCVFLDDPAVAIDKATEHRPQWGRRAGRQSALPCRAVEAERQLRRPVLGRKTSLFVGNHKSGQRYAVNSSIVMTCRKVGINPTEYLHWLLTVIDDYPASEISDLLPHNYRETRTRMDASPGATG